MGWNTVAVLLNDQLDAGECEPNLGKRIHRAVRSFTLPKGHQEPDIGAANSWPYGTIISMAHADAHQVTVTHGNMGWNINDTEYDKYLGWMALDAMKACLERNGYRVTKRRSPPRGQDKETSK